MKPTPEQLLEVARETGFLHGVSATDARDLLGRFVQAALTPPPEDPNLGKFFWWFDDDERYHMADSEAEAHGEAAQRIDDDAEPGDSREYWVARVAHLVESYRAKKWLSSNFAFVRWHSAKSVARRTERRKDKRLKSTATQ